MKYFLKINFVLLILCSSCQLKAQRDDYSTKIDSVINLKTPIRFNGEIRITQNGKTKYSKVSGFANFENKTTLAPNSQYEIMSLSKQITAVLILKEVENGKVKLQAPIKEYLPEITQTWADSVTVHQLLNHTHGIADTEKPLVSKPGTDFKYGDLSTILLGKIIENVSKKSYVELADGLFKKLKMQHTFCYAKDRTQKLVSGHIIKGDSFEVIKKTRITKDNIPADGIISTAEDLAAWNHSLHKGKILKPETYKLMTTASAQSQHNAFGKEKMGYGYNIRIAENYGIKYLGHTGMGDGFTLLSIYIPKTDVSLVILENQMPENSNLYYLSEIKIKDIVLKSTLMQ